MAFTVSDITTHIERILSEDYLLRKFEVEGEISNITYHASGHIYFTLKDEQSVLSGVMFKGSAIKLKYRPKTGDRIVARGSLTVYRSQGKYQLMADKLSPVGEGELYKRFLELKEELAEKGMFDESYKRPIPKFAKTIGVVTSDTGAVIRDIINVTRRRNPYVQIILCPALVQGVGAAESIASGIARLDRMNLDLIIVGRGGGSMEDLWQFNSEIVAEAIFASNTPIISAVGHETDFTIADFVADLRAPTPSAAAELGVYDVYELIGSIKACELRLQNSIERKIDNRRQKALSAGRHLSSLSPVRLIKNKRQRLFYLKERLDASILKQLEKKREHLKRAALGLDALSPVKRLAQGYSYVTNKKGENVYKTDDVKRGDIIEIRVTDGRISGEITDIVKEDGHGKD